MATDKTIAVIGSRGFPGIQGGVEMHCERIYPQMAATGRLRLRIYRRKPYLTADSWRSYAGIEFVDLPSTRIKGFEAAWHTLLCVLHIALHRPALVHVHNIGPAMLSPLLRLMGIPVVMTYHSPNYEHSKWGPASRAILRLAERISFRCCNRIIFVNKFQREKFGQQVLDKSCYIPNGITPTTRSTGTSFLQHHGLQPGGYLLAVGRLTPEKGFEHLVRAVQRLPQVQRLVIAGASDHNSGYAKQLRQLDVAGKVTFTGFTSGEDLRQLYSHASLYVLSSVNEGFPLVMLEAMSYGLPLAVSDIPASHLIDLPGECYFAKADPADMARVIARQLKSAPNPTAYQLGNFDWKSVAASTMHELLAAAR